MRRKVLTEAETEEAIRFGIGALAASGATVGPDAEVLADGRAALRGEITFDEAVDRAAARAIAKER